MSCESPLVARQGYCRDRFHALFCWRGVSESQCWTSAINVPILVLILVSRQLDSITSQSHSHETTLIPSR